MTNKQIVEEFHRRSVHRRGFDGRRPVRRSGFIDHDPPLPGSPNRPDGMRQIAEIWRRAFPDWRSDVQHMIAEGDLVAEHFVAHGTHRGSVMGEAPTAQDVVLRGVNIFRIRDAKIVERWGRLDDLGLLQQLGLAPAPDATPART